MWQMLGPLPSYRATLDFRDSVPSQREAQAVAKSRDPLLALRRGLRNCNRPRIGDVEVDIVPDLNSKAFYHHWRDRNNASGFDSNHKFYGAHCLSSTSCMISDSGLKTIGFSYPAFFLVSASRYIAYCQNVSRTRETHCKKGYHPS